MFGPHGDGGVVPVCSSVAEEDPHLVHRHRLDLLPPTHTDQQLVELQVMSVPVEEEER